MITLEQFINLYNLDGTYFFISVEKRENCWQLILGNSPKIGRTLDKIEPYYNKIVKNVNFDCFNNSITILLEVESNV